MTILDKTILLLKGCILFFLFAESPTPITQPTAGTYFIKVKHSGKYLSVKNNGKQNGAILWQWEKHGRTNQQFQLIKANNGYFFLKCVHSGRYLSVKNAGKGNGAILWQWDKHGNAQQQFAFEKQAGNVYMIKARHSGRYLSIKNNGKENGAILWQWDKHGRTNQHFVLEPVKKTNQPSFLAADDQSYWTTKNIQVCWDVRGFETEKQWVREAVEESWEQFGDVNFTGWQGCGLLTRGIRITHADGPGDNPHVDFLGQRGELSRMELNFTFNNFSTSCKDNKKICIKSIAIHEFGHALGFAHEHNRNDCGCDWREPQGSNPNINLTGCDEQSVMNYCAEGVDDATLSPLDVEGLQKAYGAPTRTLPAAQFAKVYVVNKGLTKIKFKIKYALHGQAPRTLTKELASGKSHTFRIDTRAYMEVSCKFLDIGTWKYSLTEKLYSFDRAGQEIKFKIVGQEAWRTDGDEEVALSESTFIGFWYTKATMTGYAGCDKNYPGVRSFYDIGTGTCWTCPAGSARTVFSVTSNKACEVPAREDFRKANHHGKGKGLLGTDCSSGQFWDPNGNCYSCPSGFTRTAHPVNSRKACVRSKPGYFTKATKKGPRCKGTNAFEDPIYGGTCWTCPKGYERSMVYPVTSDKACVRDKSKGKVPR